MSKSNVSIRFSYCAVSTVRTRAVMPMRSRFLRERQHDALELRIAEQDLELERLAGLVD